MSSNGRFTGRHLESHGHPGEIAGLAQDWGRKGDLRRIVGASWKMHKTRREAEEYAYRLRQFWAAAGGGLRVFLCPPYTAIATVCTILEGTGIEVGAQDIHDRAGGPATGEISVEMVADCGATLVEVGHSDRRRRMHESDRRINEKVQAVLDGGLTPVMCVGEDVDEWRHDVSAEVLSRQVKVGLHGLSRSSAEKVIIAYEPIWAIGLGATAAAPGHVARMLRVIRQAISEKLGEQVGDHVSVIYGGSVSAANAAALCGVAGIDGLFVGRAALDVEEFTSILSLVRPMGPADTDDSGREESA